MTISAPPGYWQREVSHMPSVLSPMTTTTLVEAANRGFRATFDDMSLLIENFTFGVIDGWGFVQITPFGGKTKLPPQPVMKIVSRVHPQLRRRIRACEEVVRKEVFVNLVDRWFDTDRPRLDTERRRLLGVNLAGLDDAGLVGHLRAARRHLDDALEVHLRLHGANAMVLGDLVFFCRDRLGWEESRALELCAGLSVASTAPGTALAALAEIARERPAVRRLLEETSAVAVEDLAHVDSTFARAFDEYQENFGRRTIRYDIVDFTLAERPEFTLRLIADQLQRPFRPQQEAERLMALRAERTAEAWAQLDDRSQDERDHFERALERAQRFYPIREERAFHTINGPLAALRYSVQEAGRRLVSRGDLADMDDVFLLEFEEALTALDGGGVDGGTVERRREETARQRLAEPPLSYGEDPGPPPSFGFLPPLARFANEAMAWVLDRNFAPDTSRLRQEPGQLLLGFGASRGLYEGTARLVTSESDFVRIQPGDVLLCPITAPPWSVLFPTIGALITDTGGILSHPAIIAREFHLPAVVGTGNATTLIPDGAKVRVDGTSGTIELLSGQPATARTALR